MAILSHVAASAGTVNGMVGGQVADLEAEGRAIQPAELEYIHRSKTAALIRASVVAGAIGGGAGDDDVARLKRFGETIGWAFQVVDDILDVEESSAALGKTAGKDAAQQKATYPSLFGLEKSRAIREGAGDSRDGGDRAVRRARGAAARARGIDRSRRASFSRTGFSLSGFI